MKHEILQQVVNWYKKNKNIVFLLTEQLIDVNMNEFDVI